MAKRVVTSHLSPIVAAAVTDGLQELKRSSHVMVWGVLKRVEAFCNREIAKLRPSVDEWVTGELGKLDPGEYERVVKLPNHLVVHLRNRNAKAKVVLEGPAKALLRAKRVSQESILTPVPEPVRAFDPEKIEALVAIGKVTRAEADAVLAPAPVAPELHVKSYPGLEEHIAVSVMAFAEATRRGR